MPGALHGAIRLVEMPSSLQMMAEGDEVRRLSVEARLLRLRGSMVVGQVTLALCQLRESLAVSKRLRMWSRELRLHAEETKTTERCGPDAGEG